MTVIYQNSEKLSTSPTTKRRKLLKRATADELPPFCLTKRDLDVIQDVHNYRALRSTQIETLRFQKEGGSPHGRAVHCRYRLSLLYHYGYLGRDEQPVKITVEGRRPLVYFLDRRGAEALVKHLGLEPEELDWRPRDNVAGASSLFLNHLLHTNDVRIAIICAGRKYSIELVRWLDDKTLKSHHWKDYVTFTGAQGSEQRAAIVPDGYFALKSSNSQSQHTEVYNDHFLLEIDLRTVVGLSSIEGKRSWDRKVRAYLAYYDSGLYQKRYQTTSLRMLTVTTSERRLQTLKRVTEQAGGKSRFWFTTFDAITAGTVLTQPIWKVAGRSDKLHTLLW